MSNKLPSTLSSDNVLRDVHSQVDNSIITSGFLVGKVGRKIEISKTTTNVPDDTQVIAFKEDGITLYTLECVYADATLSELISAERIA